MKRIKRLPNQNSPPIQTTTLVRYNNAYKILQTTYPMNDLVKEAFAKVKLDISSLKEQINRLSLQVEELKHVIQHNTQNQQTIQHITPTHDPTDFLKLPLNGLKSPNTTISTGNEGVPTNQPTNQQTNQHIIQHTGNEGVQINPNSNPFSKPPISFAAERLNRLAKVSEILQSLDDLKKEVRIKFKQLTEQEMLIFSAIYQLEEQGFIVDYSLLSNTLKLTEISIRDYVRKIIFKGIPLTKQKQQNKKVSLSISPDLKKVASLDTILQLREL